MRVLTVGATGQCAGLVVPRTLDSSSPNSRTNQDNG